MWTGRVGERVLKDEELFSANLPSGIPDMRTRGHKTINLTNTMTNTMGQNTWQKELGSEEVVCGYVNKNRCIDRL